MKWQRQDGGNLLAGSVARGSAPSIGESVAPELTRETPSDFGSSLVDHLLSGPTWPLDLVAEIEDRAKRPSREIDL